MSIVTDSEKIAENLTSVMTGDPTALIKLMIFAYIIMLIVVVVALLALYARQVKTDKDIGKCFDALKTGFKDVHSECITRYELLSELKADQKNLKERFDISLIDYTSHKATTEIQVKTIDDRTASLERTTNEKMIPMLAQILDKISGN